MDKRTKLYKQNHTKWCAVFALLLLALGIFYFSLKSAPTVWQSPVVPAKSCQFLDNGVCTNVKVTETWTQIGDTFPPAFKRTPTATPAPRRWKFLDYKHTSHYQAVIEGLQSRFTDWQPVAEIIAHESGFDPKADNLHSTAYGLGQLIEANQTVKCGVDIECQLDLTKKYIINRYGSPARALAFWQENRWY